MRVFCSSHAPRCLCPRPLCPFRTLIPLEICSSHTPIPPPSLARYSAATGASGRLAQILQVSLTIESRPQQLQSDINPSQPGAFSTLRPPHVGAFAEPRPQQRHFDISPEEKTPQLALELSLRTGSLTWGPLLSLAQLALQQLYFATYLKQPWDSLAGLSSRGGTKLGYQAQPRPKLLNTEKEGEDMSLDKHSFGDGAPHAWSVRHCTSPQTSAC